MGWFTHLSPCPLTVLGAGTDPTYACTQWPSISARNLCIIGAQEYVPSAEQIINTGN